MLSTENKEERDYQSLGINARIADGRELFYIYYVEYLVLKLSYYWEVNPIFIRNLIFVALS